MSDDRFSPPEMAHQNVSARAEDITSTLVGILRSWKAKRLRWPEMMPLDYVQAAQWWVRMQEPADEIFERPREMPVMGKGETSTRMDYPYIRRLCATLRAFLMTDAKQQGFIVAAKEEGIWWRGEDKEHYAVVIREVDSQRVLGVEEHRK